MSQRDSSTSNGEITQGINPLGLEIRIIPGRGRGVFAREDISANILLEESPVLPLTQSQWEEGRMNNTILGEYGFCWSNGGMAIALGTASLFNHSNRPNVNFIRNTKSGTIAFRTVRPVSAGEELCICYSADESKLWFRNRRLEMESELRSLKDIRLAKFVTKQQALSNDTLTASSESGDLEIQSPQPVPFTHDIVSIPKFSQDIPTALSPETLGALPPPLHSTASPSPNTPPDIGAAALVPDLEWNESDWVNVSSGDPRAEALGNVERVRGHAEIDEEEDFNAFMQIWAVDVDEPRTTRFLLNFTREMDFGESSMRHLKRVFKRTKADGQERQSVALCTLSHMSKESITSSMATFHESLASLVPYIATVPTAAARTDSELKAKAKIWPVIFSPSQLRPTTSETWSAARRAWVQAGIQRAISLALAAKDRGELPIGVFCTAQPEIFWPSPEAFIPPTPDLRASSTDTRLSTAHPLRHSVLNCVRSIAYLRTVPPFSQLQPTRNGADYLLTSLSLFMTHEPCVMCSMALLHSRVKEVFYIFPRSRGGGLNGMGVHGRKDLNHKFQVWEWRGELEQSLKEALKVDEDIAI
ncbi:hypothetical protein BD324DRAFT_605115 [Kockovaella imperatae]|uniref:SET domain-containing protein n=1 Tax=Kockovaella imperatae TaxID=4999 RepID=A0A1Y1U9P9_9TREE|nr:hypothetical protein BD324DRAFT_605115 [Kockovaella imperatae]ORX34274.1 hypothetical protein BD324DRAFT_605115 [Kockovaella imperatae]